MWRVTHHKYNHDPIPGRSALQSERLYTNRRENLWMKQYSFIILLITFIIFFNIEINRGEPNLSCCYPLRVSVTRFNHKLISPAQTCVYLSPGRRGVGQ